MLAFDRESHTYTIDGVKVPSVTQVLSILDDWEHVSPSTLRAAAEYGQHVHEAAAMLVRGELDFDSLDAGLVPPMRALDRFLHESGATVVQCESPVWHPALQYAGTLDAIVHWRNGLALVDWKTGLVPPRSVGPQTAAYARAHEQNTGQRIKRRYCVQLLDGTYRVTKLDDDFDWSVFLSCLNVYRFKNQ